MADEFRVGARHLMVWLISLPIHLYRLMLGPLMARACRFEPSCSAFALAAISQHGPLKGSWLALRRLARCHPISWLGGSSGFDPVPPAFAASPLRLASPQEKKLAKAARRSFREGGPT